MRASVADHVAEPRHAGPLDGAPWRGEAIGPGRLVVRVGLWIDAAGRVSRGRFQASSCAALIAYADAACALAEAGVPPGRLDAARIRRAVAGAHPVHHDRADLVALAMSRAARVAALEPGAGAAS